jgi:hypothetical protein
LPGATACLEIEIPAMTTSVAQQNLTNLLRYAEEVLKVSERVIADLTKDSFLTVHEQDVRGLDGVDVDPGDGCWLRFARLREIAAPSTDPMFDRWIAKPNPARPFDRPRLLDKRLIRVSIDFASELLEAGLAEPEDVMAPRDDADGSVDVLLRLGNLPEFTHAFGSYVDGPWSEWTATEQPRRRSIAIYNKLYTVQQRMIALGEDVPEECVFGVGLARWLHPTSHVNIPLIEASVELVLEQADGAILIIPRPQAPRVSLRAFDRLELNGLGRLERDATEQLERIFNDPDLGFSPFDKICFEPVLRMCCARLSASTIYEPDVGGVCADRPLPTADQTLRITNTWMIYVRQRSADFRCDDIRKLIDQVQKAPDDDSLPAPATQLATGAADEPTEDDVFDNDGRLLPEKPLVAGYPPQPSPGSHSPAGAPPFAERPLFLPLAFNEEQQQIIHRLDDHSTKGIVVQGPPGTGKTHTIANIICHYMATGRRVLVTARTPEALAAIQEKLPAEINDLTIAVIHSDRQGARQLEQAIEMLSSQVKQIDMGEYRRACADKEHRLADVRCELIETDRRISEYASLNLREVTYRGEKWRPMDLAGEIEATRSRHSWLPDEVSSEPSCDPQFTDKDIEEAREIRKQLAADIIYQSKDLPDPGDLPDIPGILSVHQALVREHDYGSRTAKGDLPIPSFAGGMSEEDARSLLDWLESFRTWLRETGEPAGWLPEFFRLLLGVTPHDKAIRTGLQQLAREWATLIREGRDYLLRGIELPGVPPVDGPFDAAIGALASGKKPFGVFAFGKGKLKTALAAVRIDGHAPGGDDWQTLRNYRRWQARVQAFLGKWTAAARAVGLPQLPTEWGEGSSEFSRLGQLVERLYDFHLAAEGCVQTVCSLFPYGVDAKQVIYYGETEAVYQALVAQLRRDDNAGAREARRRIQSLEYDRELPFGSALDEIISGLGTADASPTELAENWQQILDESKRLSNLRDARVRLEFIAARVAASGAPIWASKLLSDASEEWTALHWRESWEWAQAVGYLKQVTDRSYSAALSETRAKLEHEHRHLLREIVRLRTFMGLRRGITSEVAGQN